MFGVKPDVIRIPYAPSLEMLEKQGLLNEAIRKKAQELYEISGRKPGRDLDNWLEAERILKE